MMLEDVLGELKPLSPTGWDFPSQKQVLSGSVDEESAGKSVSAPVKRSSRSGVLLQGRPAHGICVWLISRGIWGLINVPRASSKATGLKFCNIASFQILALVHLLRLGVSALWQKCFRWGICNLLLPWLASFVEENIYYIIVWGEAGWQITYTQLWGWLYRMQRDAFLPFNMIALMESAAWADYLSSRTWY